MQRDTGQSRIILDILESVDRDGDRSQRSRASEVGVALGLVNAYLKFCIHKGYLKARKIPARGYRYMLTPKGFMEKSRLALSRLSDSLGFVHATRGEYATLFAKGAGQPWQSVVIVGSSTLAEVCAICAMEKGIRITAVVHPDAQAGHMLGVPVYTNFASIPEPFDGAVVADLQEPARLLALAEAALGPDKVAIPPFLRAALPARNAA
jgi:predicted transcriptional regulator